MSSQKSLGEMLREARVGKGLSLRGLAAQLEITPSYVSDIENDRRIPSEEVLQQFARLLAINFDDLMVCAGRFGEEAERYLKRHPAAVRLFRRISEENLDDQALTRLTEQVQKEGGGNER
jgi:transcriptional regulator with XRE-family HTH domain